MAAHPEDPHKARSLPEDRRVDYVTAVAAMVHADGEVSELELDVLRLLGEVLDISPKAMPRILEEACNPDHRKVEYILSTFESDPIRFALLTDAILVAFADEKLAAGETEQIAEFADALHISVAQAVSIARYVESALVDGGEKHELAKALAEGLADASSHVHPPRGVRWLYRKLTGGRGVL
jgi:uncharacterized tellurite resistance protein B-like protein